MKPGHVRVFVAAGSNVEPERNLERACAEIAHTWPDAHFSRAYRNVAVGFDGPDFINLVVGFYGRAAAGLGHRAPARHRNAVRPAALRAQVGLAHHGSRRAVVRRSRREDRRLHAAAPGPAQAPVHARAAGGDRAAGACIPTAARTIGELWREFDGGAHAMTPVRSRFRRRTPN